MSGRHTPRYLTPAVIAKLRSRSRRNRDVTFGRDVWPLIALEVEHVYLAALLNEREPEVDSILLPWSTARVAGDDTAAHGILVDAGLSEREMWNWESAIDPAAGRAFTSVLEHQCWLLDHLKSDIAHACAGNVRGAVSAAFDVLRDLRNEVRMLLDYGGIPASSYTGEVDRWFTPLNAHLSIGPPVRRIHELVALIEAGVATVLPPNARFDPAPDGPGFRGWSPALDDAAVFAEVLIDARLPESDVRRVADPLLHDLLRRGSIRPFRMTDADGAHSDTGAVDVEPVTHRVIDVDGRPNRGRYTFGVMTESQRWVTAAGPRPGVGSVTFSDADAIARSALLDVIDRDFL